MRRSARQKELEFENKKYKGLRRGRQKGMEFENNKYIGGRSARQKELELVNKNYKERGGGDRVGGIKG